MAGQLLGDRHDPVEQRRGQVEREPLATHAVVAVDPDVEGQRGYADLIEQALHRGACALRHGRDHLVEVDGDRVMRRVLAPDILLADLPDIALAPGDSLTFRGSVAHGPEKLINLPIRMLAIIIYDDEMARTLVAAVEVVSPANKDRATHRRAFVAKCAAYLQQGIGLIVVDVVTKRHASLHAALLNRLLTGAAPRVTADEVVAHAFSHGFHPQHTERLAAYWAEALGGPTAYSDNYGDETSVVRIHSGNGPHEEMDRRAIACFDQALQDIGLAAAEQLRRVLHDYFAWATTTTMSRYHDSADDVPEGLSIPRWSWDGLQR